MMVVTLVSEIGHVVDFEFVVMINVLIVDEVLEESINKVRELRND